MGGRVVRAGGGAVRTGRRAAGAARALLRWYAGAGRDLPWRRDPNPYRVLVSEVMLQQTTVETAVPYYERFLGAYPDVRSLAKARVEDLLALWSGLGYYQRARHLRAAARAVVRDHAGVIPDDGAALRRLPGVGAYTASAVLAIAHGRPEVALDGNLRRVLARLIAFRGDPRSRAGEETLRRAGGDLVRAGDPSSVNQALMDVGASICTPRAPGCPACPLRSHCEARRLGIAGRIPPRARNVASVPLTLAAAVLRRRGALLMRRRGGALMTGMWEFPMLEWKGAPRRGEEAESLGRYIEDLAGAPARHLDRVASLRHSITRHRIRIDVFVGKAGTPPPRGALKRGAGRGRGRGSGARTAQGNSAPEERVNSGRARDGCRVAEAAHPSGVRWIREARLAGLPLTGIARKIVVVLDGRRAAPAGEPGGTA